MKKLFQLPYLITLFILSSILIPVSLPAQSLHDRLSKAFRLFTRDPQMSHALTSLTVLNGETGAVIYSSNKDIGMASASCLKTVTAATAFYKLGKDYRYQTSLLYTGTIKDGVLNGDLIIRGSGDPSLGSWRYSTTKMEVVLREWVNAIKKAGIHQINGKIIGDATAFDTQNLPDGWIWQDVGNYYGAGTSGLTWHENQYDLHLQPGTSAGDPVKVIKTSPALSQLQFINELKTGPAGSGDQTYIYAAPYANLAFVRGTAPADKRHFIVSGSVPDPALFCAISLQKALIRANIRIPEAATTVRLLKMADKKPETVTRFLYRHFSPPMDSIIYWFLHRSINLYGEQLIKTIALEAGKPVSTAEGVEIEKKFWEKKAIPPEALNIIDGSGLSPGNHITTYAMAQVLFQIQQQEWFSTYYNCLPVIHRIRMKSGHINAVSSYAGYLTSREGTPVVFSFMVNNYSGGSQINQKMFRLLDQMK